MKHAFQSITLLFLLFVTNNVFAQTPVKHFERYNFSSEDSLKLKKEYGNNKELIPQFALQTFIALSYYPELKNTHIRFIYKQAHATLETKPDAQSIANKGNKRSFTI